MQYTVVVVVVLLKCISIIRENCNAVCMFGRLFCVFSGLNPQLIRCNELSDSIAPGSLPSREQLLSCKDRCPKLLVRLYLIYFETISLTRINIGCCSANLWGSHLSFPLVIHSVLVCLSLEFVPTRCKNN
jgi:hypothetical protein